MSIGELSALVVVIAAAAAVVVWDVE